MSKSDETMRMHNVPPKYPFWPIALIHLLMGATATAMYGAFMV